MKGEQLVEGSQAVCGIKGTIFSVFETDSITTLKVFQGTVEFSPKKSRAVPAQVAAGEKISADAGNLGEKENFDYETERKGGKSLNSKTGLIVSLAIVTACLLGCYFLFISKNKKLAGKKK